MAFSAWFTDGLCHPDGAIDSMLPRRNGVVYIHGYIQAPGHVDCFGGS